MLLQLFTTLFPDGPAAFRLLQLHSTLLPSRYSANLLFPTTPAALFIHLFHRLMIATTLSIIFPDFCCFSIFPRYQVLLSSFLDTHSSLHMHSSSISAVSIFPLDLYSFSHILPNFLLFYPIILLDIGVISMFLP